MGRNPFKWLMQRLRSAEPVLRETDLKPDRFLVTEQLDAHFAEGDSSYNACVTGSNGLVYFALSTHHPHRGARLYSFDPASDNLELLADLGGITDAPAEAFDEIQLGHGKVHVPLFELDGTIYAASSQAMLPRSLSYPGGQFLKLDMATGELEVLSKAPGEQGIISMAIDHERARLYGLTYPNGFLLACDLASGTTTNLGHYFGNGEQGFFRKPGTSPICRSLAIDQRDGVIYWSDSLGRIRAYDGESGYAYYLPGRPLVQPKIHGSYIWRQVLWHPGEEVFYGLLYRYSDLFRFDPIRKTVDFVDHIPAAPYRDTRSPHEPRATLAFCLAPGGETLYYLATGPSLITHTNRRVRRTVHLIAYHLPSHQYHDLGILRLGDGRHPVFCQSMTINEGIVYAICCIEIPSGDYEQNLHLIRSARAMGRPVESAGYIEGANLVRFSLPT